ncbi:hypothetical protein BIY37_04545 [Candidatus Brocadia sapporoensis]|uniref:Uncharacterized protein n=1 Tax=Candidatus Brocadia sapporoensis TaxID=392547 RepID=A0A1V6M196_9BACT|nr:hypothetical protein [Candidatus Brocadia sapporoensis]MDG6006271.1 hypothetical protein [Candidatus Brocadia sp.]OQD46173.1 hypothetical protein BIY37_04545 [Candidatus Brocadia sapporoensis]GJQ24648.1 MAG: hypothetical protein HBSAPP01_24380 [Candidatus Brocadia sapporoensis]
MSKSLWKKRRKTLLKIAEFSAGNIVVGGVPKPGAEIPSQIALIATDIVMCTIIYEEYFSERISEHSILEILGKSGILLVVAGGGGYMIAKSATGLIAEVNNFFGPMGWITSGILAAGGTALLGLVWMTVVDWAYRKQITLKEAVFAISRRASA